MSDEWKRWSRREEEVPRRSTLADPVCVPASTTPLRPLLLEVRASPTSPLPLTLDELLEGTLWSSEESDFETHPPGCNEHPLLGVGGAERIVSVETPLGVAILGRPTASKSSLH